MALINHNGSLVDAGMPVIAAGNRGLRYGDGLFETIKFKNNQLILIDDHLARLWSGMKLLGFEIPRLFTPDKLEKEILQLIQKNNLAAARVRLSVFRGNGGLYDPENHSPHYIIEATPLPDSNGQLNSNGLHCCIYEKALKTADSFSRCKHNNFLPYLMGAMYAKEMKCNDAIILNQHYRVCDSTIANIFLIRDGIIYTPLLSEGCVAGVMRHFLINSLPETGFSVVEKEISQEDLLEADEIFLSNSIYNIRWVGQLHDKSFRPAQTMEIYRQLQQTKETVFC